MLAMMDGKLMLTVSFFGATLPVVFFIGSAPGGGVGVFGGMSAINFQFKISAASCLSNLIQKKPAGLNAPPLFWFSFIQARSNRGEWVPLKSIRLFPRSIRAVRRRAVAL
jgi:hypothetical protein